METREEAFIRICEEMGAEFVDVTLRCPKCKEPLQEIEDSIAHKKTGHLFECKCTPQYQISIG